MTPTDDSIVLRPALWSDVGLMFLWQTEPGARRYSSNPEPPTREGHEAWLKGKLANPGCIMKIVECGGEPAGVLRFDQRLDASLVVSILISSAYQGQGVGLAALKAGILAVPGRTLWAIIDERNMASVKMFSKAGFIRQGADQYRFTP